MNTADEPALEAELPTPEASRALGRALASFLRPGDVLALYGPLGSGKTTVAKGVLEGFGAGGAAASPTFNIMHVYEGRVRVVHADAWRLKDEEEFLDAGCVEEMNAETVFVVEWADRVESWLPPDRLEVRLSHLGGGRKAELRARGAVSERFEALAEAVRDAFLT